MHVYNSWLPPPVSHLTLLETQAFSEAVRRLRLDSSSPFATLKWISVVNNLLKSRSELAISDVELFVRVVLDLFFQTNECYVQARWVGVLYKFLRKFSKKLTITLDWRPFYVVLKCYSFKRPHSFEGAALKGSQVNGLANIIRKCRRHFPKGSAAQIWTEFRPMLEDLSHNDSLEGAGFISLLMPLNPEIDSEFYTSQWFAECLRLWDGIPYCQYWDAQWGSLIARCIKKSSGMPNLDLEQFIPALFSHFLRTFEVPVGKTSGIYPYQRDVTREVMLAFSSTSRSVPKDIAKAIVYLLKPNSSAQRHLEGVIDLLEQYYHPSNGGSWTPSLERFLRHMVNLFIKRLAKEQRERMVLPETHPKLESFLTSTDRKKFITAVIRLIERGKFSKNSSLARTAAMASCNLAYVEPSLMLPLSISQFEIALDSITATHQLETAIRTIALAARALLLTSAKCSSADSGIKAEVPLTYSSSESIASCKDTLELALVHTLSGLDANDPPKTVATLQLFCSLFSSLERIGDEDRDTSNLLVIDWSQWLDDFLSRLFSLLLHLEPSTPMVETMESNLPTIFNKSFLVQGGSFYLYTLQILFSKLTEPLFDQAMKRILKFVHNQTITGAVAEIGLLCTAVVYASPRHSVVDLMMPIMRSVLSSLEDWTPTGFSGAFNPHAHFDAKLALSPALEASIIYQLNLVLLGLMFAGEHILECKELLKKVIISSFDAPSAKVNEAGSYLLSTILGSSILYYPVNQFKLYQAYPGLEGIEAWMSTKFEDNGKINDGPKWHVPNSSEITFANELLELHLKKALVDLKQICQQASSVSSGSPAEEKEHLRVLLLRIDASLRGIRSCLPDFRDLKSNSTGDRQVQPYFIAGASGATVGSVELREEAAVTLHMACSYLLEKWADDSVLLSLLAHSIAIIGNSGGLEYSEWSSARDSCHAESKSLSEPSINFITGHHVKGHRRPKWLVVELLYHHSIWRASQSHYNSYRVQDDELEVPEHILILIQDLVKLTLHNYDAVRVMATSSLKKLFKRFPQSIKGTLSMLLHSLHNRLAPEHALLGSCAILSSRPISRYLTQNFNALSTFVLAILQSAHHESLKAQNAITELCVLFIMRFGGLRVSHIQESGGLDDYIGLVDKIQSFCSNVDNTHWRYSLIAEGMLLLLSACSADGEDTILRVRNTVVGHYLQNLRTELPPLRAVSSSALLFLLELSAHKKQKEISDSVLGSQVANAGLREESLGAILLQKDFGTVVLRNLSVDHHYADLQTRSGQATLGRTVGQLSENASWIPLNSHTWPRTRTWDATMRGDAFSAKSAKLFQRLVQECSVATLEAFRGPLQETVNGLQDRGLQCATAEVIAGFLHADVSHVSDAWHEWLCNLFKTLLGQSSVELITEWSACIRFAVTGKGKSGIRPPAARALTLRCLADPVSVTASSNLIVKHFIFLCTAVTESPIQKDQPDECAFQANLLKEALNFVRHPAPQVREAVGMLICIISANLEDYRAHNSSSNNGKEKMVDTGEDWKFLIVNEAKVASIKCQKEVKPNKPVASENVLPSTAIDSNGETEDDVQQSVRFMETVLYFVITAIKSGRSLSLLNVIIELLQPILSLQETSHKDLSSLAKVSLQFLKFQIFPEAVLQHAISAVLLAADDANWRTRIASLSFLQSFLYRHTFLFPSDGLVKVWKKVENLLSDPQIEVRELASVTLTGMMKAADELSVEFRERQLSIAVSFLNTTRQRRRKTSVEPGLTAISTHAVVLSLAACVLSVPYDMPSWLPKVVTTLAQFAQETPPFVKATVRKTMAEFRRTHADTWAIQKAMFSEEELEILSDTSSSASYFA